MQRKALERLETRQETGKTEHTWEEKSEFSSLQKYNQNFLIMKNTKRKGNETRLRSRTLFSSPLARERCCPCCCNSKQVGSTKRSRPHTCLRCNNTANHQIYQPTSRACVSQLSTYQCTSLPTYLRRFYCFVSVGTCLCLIAFISLPPYHYQVPTVWYLVTTFTCYLHKTP